MQPDANGQAPATADNGRAPGADMIHFYRYVVYECVPAYLQLGWMFAADLGPPHNEYALLLCWPCGCRLAEPLSEREMRREPLPHDT